MCIQYFIFLLSLLKTSDLLRMLLDKGKISIETYEEVIRFMQTKKELLISKSLTVDSTKVVPL
jgi:hypothetical protein